MTGWAAAAELFAAADRHKPEGKRFETWSEGQNDAWRRWTDNGLDRMLLFFPTGNGKTKTCLGLIYQAGYREVTVLAPPKVAHSWKEDAATLGMTLTIMSVQKFRQPGTFPSLDRPIIVDEFHLLGGHGADGWKKMNLMARKIKAPMVIASATPNYNDAERVFCIDSICARNPNRNYFNWVIETCTTAPNYFSKMPDVTGFREYDSALDFLVKQPYTAYIEDDAVWTPHELILPVHDESHFETLNVDRRRERLMASDMEKRHRRTDYRFIDDHGLIRYDILAEVGQYLANVYRHNPKVLVFASHKTVAQALFQSLGALNIFPVYIIDGDTKTKDVPEVLKYFINEPGESWLIGTTALATGVDGIDKVCQTLLILDDIEGDDAKRRQLIGRILPRGGDDGIERIVITARFGELD